jgi:hypothetical protein
MSAARETATTLSPLRSYIRRPYVKHYLHPEVYEPVFERFAHPELSEPLPIIAQTTRIPLPTLYRWRQLFRRKQSWRPDRNQQIPNRRVFTAEQEQEIAQYITERFLERHVPITLAVLRTIILTKYQEFLQPSNDLEDLMIWMRTIRPRDNFICTRHFLANFMRRNRLSYRCVRAMRRPVINEEEVQRYCQEITKAYQTLPWDRILNADESFWLILYLPAKTVAATGAETVKVYIDGDPKAGLTLLGTVTAAGTKLPLLLVAKGLTSRCHKQFGIDLSERWPVYITHSPSGWVTQGVFNEYLVWLRQLIPHGPLCLVIDQYPTHVSVSSTLEAARLGIQLIRVPKGATGTWQPLDRRVYGVMKSNAHAKWARHFVDAEIPIPTKALAAELALQAWHDLSQDIILAAWDFDNSYSSGSEGMDSENDEAFIDVEYGHDDLDAFDVDMMDCKDPPGAIPLDDDDDNDNDK